MVFDLSNALQGASEDALARVRAVADAQRARGMEPRGDSRLTFWYATSGTTLDAGRVADELVAVDFIHRHTDYGALKEAALRALAERLKEQYRLSWTTAWTLARFYGTEMLKMYCLAKCGVRIRA